MALRGVIFDMGGTLLDYHPPGAPPQSGWRAMEDTGALALHAFLLEEGYSLPPADEARALNFDVMQRHWRQIGQGEPVNPQLGPLLRETMAAWRLPETALDDGLVDAAMAAYVAPIQGFVAPLAGARQTLAALQERGLRIGLVSNTVWPGAFHLADLERWGLAAYLECAFFSADVGHWKPKPAIFQQALAALDLAPEEAAYIGDNPYQDVYGAQGVGLKGIWLWSAEWANLKPPGLAITPDATVQALPDLLDAIEPWLSREGGDG